MNVERGPELRAVRHGLVCAAGALVLLLAPGPIHRSALGVSVVLPSALLGLLAAGLALVPRGASAWRAALLVSAATGAALLAGLAGALQLEAGGGLLDPGSRSQSSALLAAAWSELAQEGSGLRASLLLTGLPLALGAGALAGSRARGWRWTSEALVAALTFAGASALLGPAPRSHDSVVCRLSGALESLTLTRGLLLALVALPLLARLADGPRTALQEPVRRGASPLTQGLAGVLVGALLVLSPPWPQADTLALALAVWSLLPAVTATAVAAAGGLRSPLRAGLVCGWALLACVGAVQLGALHLHAIRTHGSAAGAWAWWALVLEHLGPMWVVRRGLGLALPWAAATGVLAWARARGLGPARECLLAGGAWSALLVGLEPPGMDPWRIRDGWPLEHLTAWASVSKSGLLSFLALPALAVAAARLGLRLRALRRLAARRARPRCAPPRPAPRGAGAAAPAGAR